MFTINPYMKIFNSTRKLHQDLLQGQQNGFSWMGGEKSFTQLSFCPYQVDILVEECTHAQPRQVQQDYCCLFLFCTNALLISRKQRPEITNPRSVFSSMSLCSSETSVQGGGGVLPTPGWVGGQYWADTGSPAVTICKTKNIQMHILGGNIQYTRTFLYSRNVFHEVNSVKMHNVNNHLN